MDEGDEMKLSREQRFTNIVRRLMARRSLSTMDVAERLDVSRPTVQRWVDGVNQPHPAMWKHVFSALRKP